MATDEAEGTFSHEESLGDLPVPNLKETLEKYLRSVKPFLSEQEYEHTEAVTKDFEEGVGQELQQQLLERAKTEKNWVRRRWPGRGRRFCVGACGGRGHAGKADPTHCPLDTRRASPPRAATHRWRTGGRCLPTCSRGIPPRST